jgi:SAM-dependent methyltransferase
VTILNQLAAVAKPFVPEFIRQRVRAERQRRRSAMSYHEIAVREAEVYCSIEGNRILVVGANTGEDCERFVRRRAGEVHGLDVIEQVGQNFSHPKVVYHRQSIEKTSLPSDHFDLVFAVATMEHVPDVAAGFAEMARLVCPGGVIYSSAAPLWESPFGHHMSSFADHPWVHLLFDAPALVAYARSHGIEEERGHDIEDIAAYMLDPANFNMRPASEYLGACAELPGLQIIENVLSSEDSALLNHPLGQRAIEAGFRPESLLATRHLFVARKIQ